MRAYCSPIFLNSTIALSEWCRILARSSVCKNRLCNRVLFKNQTARLTGDAQITKNALCQFARAYILPQQHNLCSQQEFSSPINKNSAYFSFCRSFFSKKKEEKESDIQSKQKTKDLVDEEEDIVLVSKKSKKRILDSSDEENCEKSPEKQPEEVLAEKEEEVCRTPPLRATPKRRKINTVKQTDSPEKLKKKSEVLSKTSETSEENQNEEVIDKTDRTNDELKKETLSDCEKEENSKAQQDEKSLKTAKKSSTSKSSKNNKSTKSTKTKKSGNVKESPKTIKEKSPVKSDEKVLSVEDDSENLESVSTKEKSVEKPAQAADMWSAFFKKNSGGVKTEDVLKDYDPTKSKYDPIEDACWKENEVVPYLALCKTFEYIEATSGRLKTIEILSNFFRSVIMLTPEDLIPCACLSLNQLFPSYIGIELGIGESILCKALAQATGAAPSKIKAEIQSVGDLGLVAERLRTKQKVMMTPAPLTVRAVFKKLREVAEMTGNSAQNKKVEKIQALLVACRQCEARFLVRALAGKMRMGLAEQSLLMSLGRAVAQTPPGGNVLDKSKNMSSEKWKAVVEKASLAVRTAYCECPNLEEVCKALVEVGVEGLPEKCSMKPGIPLKPMLAHPTSGVKEVLRRFDGAEFVCEWKYDGERAQVHVYQEDDQQVVKIYSRNSENNTSKYPDVIGRISSSMGDSVTSCILDTEAVAWDPVKQCILPFQILSTRKRKDAQTSDIKVQVCLYVFDLLYLNGESLVSKSLRERRDLLARSFQEVPGEFIVATALISGDTDRIAEFLEESIKGNCEGLMVKALDTDANYEIAKRSRSWLKLKKDYLEGVGDTLDLVVIGAYHGAGKRAGKYGGFLLACYDADNEIYQSICKIGTGFSDEDLDAISKRINSSDGILKSARNYYEFGGPEPDVWLSTDEVWEVKCADLSLSPVHRAAVGIVDSNRGISLRFPRFVRRREDKKAEDATSAQQVADMYRNQDQVKNQVETGAGAGAEEEEFY